MCVCVLCMVRVHFGVLCAHRKCHSSHKQWLLLVAIRFCLPFRLHRSCALKTILLKMNLPQCTGCHSKSKWMWTMMTKRKLPFVIVSTMQLRKRLQREMLHRLKKVKLNVNIYLSMHDIYQSPSPPWFPSNADFGEFWPFLFDEPALSSRFTSIAII